METIQQIHVSKMTGKLEGFKAISTNTTSNAFCLKMFNAKNIQYVKIAILNYA